ncbi:MAG: hypothetical protein MUE51_01515 [Thermoleophilia bacterium]|nr:hypothetical protein [Thermoleophilia bacterium]
MRCPLRSALLAGLVLALVGPGGAWAADPALDALRGSDAYVSTRVLGEAAEEGRARLAAVADELGRSGRPVKLAVVAGPTGAPSMRAYVRRLRQQLGFEGFVVATAPRRQTVAVGPRAPAEITRDLRRAQVGSIRNPVDRVEVAARSATGPSPEPDGGGAWRGLLALLGLALIGGAWAAAWGVRRERRHQRIALVDARARAAVQLDALAARADALAVRDDLPPAARPDLDRAIASARSVKAELDQARSAADVDLALPELRAGLAAVAEAQGATGDPVGDDPFWGLCRVDPGHGPAVAEATPAGAGDAVPVCARCAERAAQGEPPARRMVPVGGHPVPFDEAGLGAGLPEDEEG